MQGKAGLHQGQGGAVRLQAEKCGRSAVICVLPDRSSIVQMTINRQDTHPYDCACLLWPDHSSTACYLKSYTILNITPFSCFYRQNYTRTQRARYKLLENGVSQLLASRDTKGTRTGSISYRSMSA